MESRALPAPLLAVADELEEAGQDYPEFVDDSYVTASGPECIGNILREKMERHMELEGLRIAYLWQEEMKRAGRVVLGKASVANKKVKHFAEVDFVIEVSRSEWENLTTLQRVALIDHELMHCTVNLKGKAKTRGHDLEEFRDIVKDYGLWQPDVEAFAKIAAEQLTMSFAGT